MRLRSSSRWSRKPMVGICSLSDAFTGEEAASSGIGRYFRSGLGRWGDPGLYDGFGSDRDRFGSGGFNGLGFSSGILGSFQPFRRRRIEDAVGQRSERSLQRWQNLLPGVGLSAIVIKGTDFRFDLRTEFVGGAAELAEEAGD